MSPAVKRLVLPLAVVVVSLGFAPADNGPASPTFSLPAHASEVAPGVFFLGTAVDNGRVVEGYAFESLTDAPPPRDSRGNAKPPWAGGPGSGGGDDEDADASSCYSYIANGAKWRVIENYLLDPTGITGVTDGEFETAMERWESAAGTDIIGNSQGPSGTMSADTSTTDGRNEIYFAPISDTGVLGYTIVWYTRGGPPRSRQIVEADMVIDTEWNWFEGHEGDGIAPDQMHFWGVVVHEAGHYMGLGHTDGNGCDEQTMYPYLSAGDDSKESLELGDIAGIQSLYP